MRFFSLPKIILFFASIFSRKKCKNHGFWPPKTLPKSIQNAFKIDVPKNMDCFEVFCYSFCIFVILETLKISIFPRENPLFLRFSLKTCSCNFHVFSIQKTYQKPFQNEVRTMKKSMSKTCCFLTSIFGGSGFDFGESWASNLEPS